MDQTELKQKIALYYSKLPAETQKLFSTMKWMEDLKEITKKYKLTDEQNQVLGIETTLVLLGIIDAEEYSNNIKKEVVVSTESSQKILDEIGTVILNIVHPEFKETYKKNITDTAEEKYGGAQKLDERFLKLPKEVQFAISESGYQKALYAIASKHKLSINEMGALEEATTKVMLSIIHPDKYEAELQSNIAKTKEEIMEIANEVNEGILKNIREILKNHWGSGSQIANDIDDEVPTPPYAKSPMQESILAQPKEEVKIETKASGVESSIYKSAGIEMVDKKESAIPPVVEKEKKMSPMENILLMESGIDMLSNKLNQSTVSKTVVSDHSLPKIQGSAPESKVIESTPTTKAHDPYHEVIE